MQTCLHRRKVKHAQTPNQLSYWTPQTTCASRYWSILLLQPPLCQNLQHSPGPHWLWRWWFSSDFLSLSPAYGCLWSAQNVSWEESRQCIATWFLETSDSPSPEPLYILDTGLFLSQASPDQTEISRFIQKSYYLKFLFNIQWFKGKVYLRYTLRAQAS